MLRILRGVIWAVVLACLAVVAVIAFAPRAPVVVDVAFDESVLAGGIDAYLSAQEARFDDISDGVEKRVIWAGAPGAKAPWSVVYLHGFSASSEEIRPVPDDVARGLGANLVFTRLAGHGRGGAAMADPSVQDWMYDVAEALAIGRATGERVLVIGTSTGGTLATLAATQEHMMAQVAGLVLVSPNFRVKSRSAVMLTWPLVQYWGPWVAGAERSFTPQNEGHGTYWTTRYPTTALLPMAASVAAARALDHATLDVPVQVITDARDRVVDAMITEEIARSWGGPARITRIKTGPQDDPFHHVIAGDILSPAQTEAVVAAILDWAAEL